MSNRIGICLFLFLIVMSPVNTAAGDLVDLNDKSTHDLIKIQDRLELMENIRSIELNILEMEAKGKKLTAPLSHTIDSTKPPFAPVKKKAEPEPKPEPKETSKRKIVFEKKKAPAKTVVEVKPVQPKKNVKPKSRSPKKKTPPTLPKIVAIKGSADTVYADLEFAKEKGTIRVFSGDPILAGAFTVSLIDHTGVMVKDKKGKTQRLAFKTTQQVVRASSTNSSKRGSKTISSRYKPVFNAVDSTVAPKD